MNFFIEISPSSSQDNFSFDYEESTKIELLNYSLLVNSTKKQFDTDYYSSEEYFIVFSGFVANAKSLLEGDYKINSHNLQKSAKIILFLYEKYGSSCVNYMCGSFLFIVINKNTGDIFGACDQAGTKHLYILKKKNNIYFSFNIETLLKFKKNRKLNKKSLCYFLTLGYIPSPHTVWENIKRLEAGCAFSWNPNIGLSKYRYWEPPRNTNISDDSLFKELWEQVIFEYSKSAPHSGLFLSAGLDSTSLAVGLSSHIKNLQAFSVGFADQVNDESKIAQNTAERLGLTFSSYNMQLSKVQELLTQYGKTYNQPLAYGSTLNILFLLERSHKKVSLIFGGDGGDEVLGGYNWYTSLGDFKVPISRRIIDFIKFRSKKIDDIFNERSRSSFLQHHALSLSRRFLPEEASQMVFGDQTFFNEKTMLTPLRKWYCKNLPHKRAAQRIDLMNFSTDVIIPKVIDAANRYEVELRLPFLDKRIMEWGISRPMENKYESKPKYVLHTYLRKKVSREVLNRPKQGFSLRCMELFDFDQELERISQSTVLNSIFDKNFIYLAKKDSIYKNSRIWTLCLLETWLSQHITK